MQADDAWTRHMRSGNWEAAWRISDSVLCQRAGQACLHLPRHLQYVWDGTPIEGRRVLVRCYHGLGDTIQFIRFAPLLKQVAAEVTVWVQPLLIPLVQTVPGIDRILPLHDGTPDADYDLDIELMELPHALRITPSTLPATVPYFHLPALPHQLTDRRHKTTMHVGVVWRSGNWDNRRSVPFTLIRQLASTQNLSWRVLQRGPAVKEWNNEFGERPPIRDVLDEAAALQALDLLITVDTMSAHLAGALGVRTWTLLPACADWRWMENREDSPWYPTMRLYRQQRPGDWQSVLDRVAVELTLARDAWQP